MFYWVKIFPYAAAFCVAAILAMSIYKAGQKSAQLECMQEQSAQKETVINEVKKHAKIKQEVRSLNDDELIRRYCHWVYDIPYSECVRTYKFVQ